jgi:hypothetical protein
LLPATLNDRIGAIQLERKRLEQLDTWSNRRRRSSSKWDRRPGYSTRRTVPNKCSVTITMNGALMINEHGG